MIPSASAILESSKNSLRIRRVVSWALARIWASRARMSSSDMPSRFSCVTSRLIVLFSSRETRSAGSSNGVCRKQLIEELAADRLPLLGPDPPLQDLAHGRTERLRAVDIDRVEKRLVQLGKPESLQIVDVHLHRRPSRRASSGSTTDRPELGLELARVARLGTHERARIGDRAVLEPKLRLQAKLDLLELVQRLAVRAEESEVGREIVAELGGPFELGHDLAVALEKPRELLVDVLVGQLGDRPLDLEPLVIRHVELRPNLDVHLEIHRPVFGHLDRRRRRAGAA